MASTQASTSGTGEVLKPDQDFIREVVRRGGDSVKKCFQCGTCSVRCLQTSAREGASFPRKQMLLTQWGLKDRVLADPDIWLCHQCNDCSVYCPRGSKPGDVLAALRGIAIERFSFPRFLGKFFAEPRFLPLMFGIPAAILLVLVAALQGFSFPAGDIEYDRFIKDTAIEITAAILVAYAVIVASISTLRLWRALQSAAPDPALAVASGGGASEALAGASSGPSEGPGAMAAAKPGLAGSLVSTAGGIALHTGFRQCQAERLRLWGHLAAFYAMPLLMVAAGLAALYGFTGQDVQRPPSDPAKLFGNLGGLLLFVGVMVFAYNRLRTRDGSWGRAVYSDWLLLGMLFAIVVTGAFMEVARYAGSGAAAYSLYLVHLVIVFAAFVYAPYGKFAHTFYRAAALTFAKATAPGGLLRGGGSSVRLKAGIQALVLAVLMGALAWHTIWWHNNGMQAELFNGIGDSFLDTVKGVGYNLGLMFAAGALLGLFMERFTVLIGYEVKKIEHFTEEEEPEAGSPGESGSGEQVA
jgi:quinone-modifying oxidoreductase subunit QmoC